VIYARVSHAWNSVSLRAKITGLILVLVALGLLVSQIGTQSMLRSYLTAQIDKQLESTAQILNDVPASEAQERLTRVSGLLPSQYLVMYFDSNGRGMSGFKPYGLEDEDLPTLSTLSPRTHAKNLRDGTAFNVTSADQDSDWRVLGLPIAGGGALLVALPTTSVETTISQYQLIFGTFGALVLLLSGLLGWWLAESLFSPLRRVERAATRIAGGDYSSRLPGANTVTEVGRLNASLNAMSDDIEHAFADRQSTIAQMRRFVADAGHELRTPLVSVRGYAELYRMGALPDDEAVRKAMDRIEHEAIRMGHLVEDLLELARLDDPKPINATETNLVALAEGVAMDARVRAPDRTFTVLTVPPEAPTATQETPSEPGTALSRTGKIHLSWSHRRRKPEESAPAAEEEVRPHSPEMVLVRGEAEKLQQVMTNLVGNALRYTPEGSPIELACGYSPEGAFFEIRDHGDGIPPQIRTKIFERFWRADTSRTRETGGTGLGLSIVAAIVHAHRGEVEVRETPGGGATFRVDLPLDAGPRPPQTAQRAAAPDGEQPPAGEDRGARDGLLPAPDASDDQ
jgi:two-component system OmpR family sensor kinase